MSTLPSCRGAFESEAAAKSFASLALTARAQGMAGSSILKVAYEIRALMAEGRPICDLTVGDFAPEQFRVPEALARGVAVALERGETNYPPAFGMQSLRDAIAEQYRRDLGLDVSPEQIVVGSGARPPIFATFSLLVEPGDRVLVPQPSWNNNHYVHLSSGRMVKLPCHPETDFLPTPSMLDGNLDGATLLSLNSPLNPAGTCLSEEALVGICERVLGENARRARRGARPLMVMYDQVYWMLTFRGRKHLTPMHVAPEMAKYTILVDAISKSFAATGVRVGWGVVPEPLVGPFRAFVGHMGAWAPRAEQVATAAMLRDADGVSRYHAALTAGIEARLEALHGGIARMAADGLPVRSIAPQGAIYLSACFDIAGRRWGDRVVRTHEDVRQFLLQEAGFGVVPMSAFGPEGDVGWVRLSIGAVSVGDIEAGLARIAAAMRRLG
jgi:aspartate aminotransferase